MTIKDKAARWINNAANAATFWTLAPSGTLAVIGGYLSRSVGWINVLGAFGWFASGLLIFFVSALTFALVARTKLWRVEAKSRARVMGDSSPFDPMARVYQNKRIYLRDLAPLGRRQVIGKTFISCEIIGPGSAVLGLRSDDTKPFPTMRNCGTFDVDCIEIDQRQEARSQLAVEFYDCDFDECKFYHMSLLFVQRENDALHWITKDSRQPFLIEQQAKPGLVEIMAERAKEKGLDDAAS